MYFFIIPQTYITILYTAADTSLLAVNIYNNFLMINVMLTNKSDKYRKAESPLRKMQS